MRTLTREEMNAEYLIYKDLMPKKNCRTYLAMKESSNGSLYPVILKEMDKKRAAIYQRLCSMWNPYIAEVYDIFQLSSEQEIYVAVTEYVIARESPTEECLSLTQFVRHNGPLSEQTALSIGIQLCEGLKDVHKTGFIHRDLKPDNIMLSAYDLEHPLVKIIDFGGAKELDTGKDADTTVIGTLGYQPPESLSTLTTEASDIYSIGCILNFMLTGQEPGMQRYKKEHYIVNILERATNEDPSHRFANVTALQKHLEHELRIRPLDKIPFLRALPGFRTHTLWKEVSAMLVYLALPLLAYICLTKISITAFIEIFLFYIFFPLIILCNMGNLLRFFPESLRKNNRIFSIIQTFLLVLTFLGPIFVDYFIMRF